MSNSPRSRRSAEENAEKSARWLLIGMSKRGVIVELLVPEWPRDGRIGPAVNRVLECDLSNHVRVGEKLRVFVHSESV